MFRIGSWIGGHEACNHSLQLTWTSLFSHRSCAVLHFLNLGNGKKATKGAFTRVPDAPQSNAGTGIRFNAMDDGTYVIKGFIPGSAAAQCGEISVGALNLIVCLAQQVLPALEAQ